MSKLDKYPIPKVEDLFAKLAGGKTFTKLDLSQAYQQLPLDKESKKYVVINTQKGLFRTLGYRIVFHPHQEFFKGSWRLYSRGFQGLLST